MEKFKLKRETDDHIIEYSPKLAILRLTLIIFLIFFIYMVSSYIFSDKEEEKSKGLDLELIEIEEKKELTFEENSRGELFSLKENVFAQGSISFIEKEDKLYLQLSNFKITNNKNLFLYFSTNVKGGALVEIAKLTANIGNLEYEVPNKVDTSLHKYVLIRDTVNRENFAYSELK
jgi:hypothetical protein